jgi:OOP family OmpA-OmpF porin
MNNIGKLLLFIVISNIVYAGGDITIVTPYETDDAIRADEEAVEYIEPISTPEPQVEYSAPEENIPEPEPTPAPIVELPKEAVKNVVTPPPSREAINPNGFYVGLGISGTRYHSHCPCNSGIDFKEKSLAVAGRVGYDYNQYIGVEARGIKDFAEDDKASISHAGVFIKPMYPITKDMNLYGLIGMAKTKTSGDYPKVNSESLALGAGIEYDLSKDEPKNGKYNRDFDGAGDQEKGFGLFLDYERMVVKKNAPLLDTVSAGVTYDF